MPLNVLRDIRRIYSCLNATGIRRAASVDLNIGLMAASDETYRLMERFLVPAWMPDRKRQESLRRVHRIEGAPGDDFDFVLCEPGIPVPPNGYVFDPGDPDFMARAI